MKLNLSIDIDLESVLAKALSAEKLEPIINKYLAEAVTSAVESATGYRSEFRKKLAEQLISVLPHGLESGDVVKFQHILNKAMTDVVNCKNQDAVTLALEHAVKRVMPDSPTAVKMSELLKEARSYFGTEPTESFFAYYETDPSGEGWLYLDSDLTAGYGNDITAVKYRAKYQLAFNSTGRVDSLQLDNVEVSNSYPAVVSMFETTLMAMYVGRTTLEVDMTPEEVIEAAAAAG